LDQFSQSLPNIPRNERHAVVRQELIRLSEASDLMGLESQLESIRRLGRKWEKLLLDIVNEILKEPNSTLSQGASELLRRFFCVELQIRGKETGIRLRELEQLLHRLESIRKLPRPCLRIKFDTPDAYVYGLCAIAAWAACHAQEVEFTTSYPRVEYFLERSGVKAGLREFDTDPVRFDTETILGFTRIDPDERFPTDTHAGRLMSLFNRHAEIDQKSAEALSISFAELIENAVKHGAITSPAWLFANFHPQPRIMHVCICDRGIGVRETFRRSENDRLRELSAMPVEWLREATQPLVTSKSSGHAGYGLYLVRELCRANGGSFSIVSGPAAYSLHPEHHSDPQSMVEQLRPLSFAWNGTIVAMQFHLDRPLNVGPVYETLPSPDDDADIPEVSLFDE